MADIKVGDVVICTDNEKHAAALAIGGAYKIRDISGGFVQLEGMNHLYMKKRFVLSTDVKPAEKPPLGLRPRYVAEAMRIQEIMDAALRYTEAGKQVPQDWLDELVDLKKQK